MLDLKRKKKEFKKIYLRVGIVILGVLILFAGNATWNLYLKYREAKLNKEIAQTELKKLQKRERDILSELGKLSTDKGIEEELRKKFGIVKEGEKVIVIVEPKASGEKNKEETVKYKFGIWDKILNIFRFDK